jgi:hypothetical protein
MGVKMLKQEKTWYIIKFKDLLVTTEWVTVPNSRDMYIRHRRMPLTEIYCLIFENFHITYTNRSGESSVKARSVCGVIEVGGVAVLPALISRRIDWLSSETAEALCFQKCSLEIISES